MNRTTPATDGQLIEKNTERIEIKEDGTLEITAVRPSDVGSYSCVVTSPGGNETRSARLTVIELPFAPTNGLLKLKAIIIIQPSLITLFLSQLKLSDLIL